MPKDPQIVEHDIQEHGAAIDQHHDPSLALSAVKGTHRLRDQHGPGAETEDAEIDHFMSTDIGGVSGGRENRVCQEHREHGQGSCQQGNPDCLPDKRADAIVLTRSVMLGNKGAGVHADPERAAEQCPPEQRSRERSGQRVLGPPCQKHAVDERQQRPRQAGEYQRHRQSQHVTAAARLMPPERYP